MPTKRRYSLKTKEARQVLADASTITKIDLESLFGAKTNVEVAESDIGFIYIIGCKPLLFKTSERILPTLQFDDFVSTAPKIVVDMGAVPYVCKGATIMAPGIVRIEGDFLIGDLVVVVDMKFGKALGIGEALIDSATARQNKKGPVVKTLHYVSDKIWDIAKAINE